MNCGLKSKLAATLKPFWTVCQQHQRHSPRTPPCLPSERCSICREPISELPAESILCITLTLSSRFKNSYSLPSRDVLDHPKFRVLCIKLERIAPHLNDVDIVDAIKICQFLGVESNSKLMLVLCNLLRHHINELTLEQVTFVDFILEKMIATPIVMALRIALPMVFQLRIANEMDIENLPRLIGYLQYASKHTEDISGKTVNLLVSAIMLHAKDISVENAKSIVWMLGQWARHEAYQSKLLDICIERICQDMTQLRTNDLELLVTKFTIKCAQRCDDFYSLPFFTRVVDELINRDMTFEGACDLCRDFLRIVSTHS